MHLDHPKFVDLLVENSGQDREKVEKQLVELISDIKSALTEDEAYEIEGFGIFSKLGNNVMFIPSEGLETEINYKYVGMEPIEVPGGGEDKAEEPQVTEDNPIAGIMDAAGNEDYEDPFAELLSLDEEEENQEEIEEEAEEAVEEVIESEDEESEDPFEFETEQEEAGGNEPLEEESLESDIAAALESELKDDDDALEDDLSSLFEDDEVETESFASDDDLLGDEVFGGDEESIEEELGSEIEEAEEKADEIEELASEEKELADTPGPEDWGIEAHKEEGQENAFDSLLGDIDDTEVDQGTIDSEAHSEDEEIDFSALEDSEGEEDEDFDDPFAQLEDDEPDATINDDFVPIVTNVSKDKTREKEEEKPQEEDKKPKKEKKVKKKKEGSPALLYVLLFVVIIAGGGYLAAYFGVVNVDGITPPKYTLQPQVVQNTPPVQQSVPQVQAPPAENLQSETETTTPNTAQPEEVVPDQNPVSPAEDNPQIYGLTGNLSQAGNSGYTIVLYSLSRKAGADEQLARLRNEGFRAMVAEVPSSQYGVLYRVSVGQFESLASAAATVEENKDFFKDGYFIKKIQ